MKHKKVAIVHDWLYGGGAEKVVQELRAMYPEAPIYTSFCTDEWREKLDSRVITGYLQRWPFRHLRKFLPLLRQWWFASLDLSAYNTVISSSGNGEAKFVRVPKSIEHICYCHTPTHFYWRQYEQYASNPGFRPKWLARLGLRMLVKPLRRRDYQAAQRVDRFIANSTHIQADIKQFYNRDSVVVHPPVAVERFRSAKSSERSGYITVGRQTPYKRVDLIIQACNELKLPLTVVGNGPEHARLQQLAGPSVTLRTDVDDEELPRLLASAEGFVFAVHEDFGIAPVEAMAAGTPVIAYQAGGALDYVESGKTGLFFAEQTVSSLVDALKQSRDKNWQHEEIAQSADRFSAREFRIALKKQI
jgi:glycosyltransferase involved in cell wall biosynthesis